MGGGGGSMDASMDARARRKSYMGGMGSRGSDRDLPREGPVRFGLTAQSSIAHRVRGPPPGCPAGGARGGAWAGSGSDGGRGRGAQVMKGKGWIETDGDDWDIFYADVGWIHENIPYAGAASGGLRLSDHQRVNHFPNHVELTRKDLMAKNLKRMKRALEKDGRLEEAEEYDILPTSYNLPSEYALFVRSYKDIKQSGEQQLWIMKPIGRAQGKGIFIVNKLSQMEAWMKERGTEKADNCCYEDYVCQRYIHNPYLVCGRKFDMRLYALCLSYVPLKVYLYREGFARFTSARYNLTKESLQNNFIHLTNHAIQKHDVAYDPNTTDLKWPIRNFKLHLIGEHGQEVADKVYDDIQKLIIHSLKAVQNTIINDKHCFEMYGYDIMIDENLKPWLIEVNASPSMSADTDTDRKLKTGLLEDMFSCVDMENNFGGRCPPRVGSFDLIHDENGIVKSETLSSVGSTLGCCNDRERQNRTMKRQIRAAGNRQVAPSR